MPMHEASSLPAPPMVQPLASSQQPAPRAGPESQNALTPVWRGASCATRHVSPGSAGSPPAAMHAWAPDAGLQTGGTSSLKSQQMPGTVVDVDVEVVVLVCVVTVDVEDDVVVLELVLVEVELVVDVEVDVVVTPQHAPVLL